MGTRKPNRAAPHDRRTCGYVRVSTQDQAVEGVSLEAQEARIRAYCVAQGWRLDAVLTDAGESAKNLHRPGVEKLIDGIRRGSIERIVILKLDRLTRSVRDLADMLDLAAKHDAALVSVSESLDTKSACGKLMLNVIGSVAQWEREVISERTTENLAHKRQKGEAYGPTPFGYRRDGKRLVKDARQQKALIEAQRLDRDGATYREIGEMLQARGIKPRGERWYDSSVRSILRSKMATESAK